MGSMIASPAVEISDVGFRYGERKALEDVDLTISRGEIFAVLGPNGGGKSTLFRLLSTLIPVEQGAIRVLGSDVTRATSAARRRMGVVFQAASVDKKLTVLENLMHQGHLYGMSGEALKAAADEMLERLGVADRKGELAERLSGGLRRRVEIAKGMLHGPELLLMDEPSTGLDPGARADLWRYLRRLRDEQGTTVVATTHFLDEAEHADRLAILDAGRIVALDTPDALKASIGGDTITIEADEPVALMEEVRGAFGLDGQALERTIRFHADDGHEWISRLVNHFGERIRTITVGRPTLEDVFIANTGHQFWVDDGDDGARGDSERV